MYLKSKMFLLSLLIGASAYSVSIDHIQNYTPEYLSNQAQTGMINTSSVYYNPAGLSQLKDGLYIKAGIQRATGNLSYTYEYGTDKKVAKETAPIKAWAPNISAYYIKNSKGIYTTIGALGGGSLEYNGGKALALITHQMTPAKSYMGGSSKYMQATLGGFYNINDNLSFSVGVRRVWAERNMHAKAKLGGTKLLDVNVDKDSKALGYQLGLNYKINDNLNLGVRYDSKVQLKYVNKTTGTALSLVNSKMPHLKNGKESQRDLPAILSVGLSGKVNDNLTLATSANIYFNKNANIDNIVNATPANPEGSHSYNNGYEVSLGGEYQLNDKVALSAGVTYSNTGATKYSASDFPLNAVTLGAGLKYTPSNSTEIYLGVMNVMYKGVEQENTVASNTFKETYNKNMTAVGLSLTKRF